MQSVVSNFNSIWSGGLRTLDLRSSVEKNGILWKIRQDAGMKIKALRYSTLLAKLERISLPRSGKQMIRKGRSFRRPISQERGEACP